MDYHKAIKELFITGLDDSKEPLPASPEKCFYQLLDERGCDRKIMKPSRNFSLSVLLFWLIPALIPLFAVTGVAQSSRRKETAKPVKITTADIRRIDFLNFSYQSSFCSKELKGLGKIVRVNNGNFQTDSAYFGVVNNRIIYGDLTNDGREEAVVHTACGESGANIGLSDIFVYTRQNGQTDLIAGINDKDMEADYARFFPNGILWRIVDNGVKVKNGNLLIQRFAEGSLSNPDYILTLEYALQGKNFVLQKRPQRLPRVTKK